MPRGLLLGRFLRNEGRKGRGWGPRHILVHILVHVLGHILGGKVSGRAIPRDGTMHTQQPLCPRPLPAPTHAKNRAFLTSPPPRLDLVDNPRRSFWTRQLPRRSPKAATTPSPT
eukprot:365758-Chlamydomonas_euryale.AAC.17